MSAPEDVIREALRKWQTFSGAYGLGSEFSNDAALAALTQLVEERDRAFEDGQRSALRREARSLRDEDYEQLVVDLREARARAEAAEAALRGMLAHHPGQQCVHHSECLCYSSARAALRTEDWEMEKQFPDGMTESDR